MKVDFMHGAVTWADLSTTNEDDAQAFYAALFGWQGEPQALPMGGFYHMEKLEADNVAGISRQQPDEASAGVPPHWNVYLGTSDLEATLAKVRDAGGMVLMGPMEVMESGSMAFIQDPTGAVVGLWQPSGHRGFARQGEPGALSWAELMTSDAAEAAEFYSQVLGLPSGEYPMPDAPAGAEPYRMVQAAEGRAFGIMKKTPEMGDMPNVWSTYWEVEDTDATAERARDLGGRVLQPPFDVATVGRIAILQDPQGAVFGVIKSAPMPQG